MTIDQIAAFRGIPQLDPSERMKTAWLRDLAWPRDSELIKHLSREDFRAWMYGLEPRDAMLLSCQDGELAKIQKRKRNFALRCADWLWRWRHGYC